MITALIVLIEPVWTKQQDALVSWWRGRRGTKQDSKGNNDAVLDETEK
jgi:hypothetical protein